MRIRTSALISVASLLLCAPLAAQTFEVVQQPQKKSSTTAKPATKPAETKKATPIKSTPVNDTNAAPAKSAAKSGASTARNSAKSKSAVAAKKKAADSKKLAETKPAEPEATETVAAAPKKEEVVPPPAPFKSNLPGAVIVTGEDTQALKVQIESALQRDASLMGSALNVNIDDKGVELTGQVNSGKERVAARRIAQSYSGNRRVQDKITVMGQADTQLAQKPTATQSSDSAGNLPQSDQGAAKKKNGVPTNQLVPKADKTKPETNTSTPPPVRAQ